jgi:hypothetical protein
MCDSDMQFISNCNETRSLSLTWTAPVATSNRQTLTSALKESRPRRVVNILAAFAPMKPVEFVVFQRQAGQAAS